MRSDDEFARWAALFVSAQSDDGLTTLPVTTGTPISSPGAVTPAQTGPIPIPAAAPVGAVTAAAYALLQSVDSGGIPAFVTSHLKQIALDNGIPLTDQWTPNQIVEAIRRKASYPGAAP